MRYVIDLNRATVHSLPKTNDQLENQDIYCQLEWVSKCGTAVYCLSSSVYRFFTVALLTVYLDILYLVFGASKSLCSPYDFKSIVFKIVFQSLGNTQKWHSKQHKGPSWSNAWSEPPSFLRPIKNILQTLVLESWPHAIIVYSSNIQKWARIYSKQWEEGVKI